MGEQMLTEAQSGTRITVHVGDTLRIVLPENPAAGYRWDISTLDRDLFTIVSHTFEGQGGGIGSGGNAVLVVGAHKAGTARLTLAKRRSWGPQDASSAMFTVDVEVDQ